MEFSHFLVPSDGSERSRRAIDQAVALAARLGARITFLHVHPSVPLTLTGLGDSLDPRTLELLIAAGLRESDRILAEASAQAAEGTFHPDGPASSMGTKRIPITMLLKKSTDHDVTPRPSAIFRQSAAAA